MEKTLSETLAAPPESIAFAASIARGNLAGWFPEERIFDRAVTFSDGRRMAILAHVRSDGKGIWVQGLLYSAEGDELGETACSGSLLGEFAVDLNHNGENVTYAATVVAG